MNLTQEEEKSLEKLFHRREECFSEIRCIENKIVAIVEYAQKRMDEVE